MITHPLERLSTEDLMTIWAGPPAGPAHLAVAGLFEAGPLVDGAGRVRLAELREALRVRLARVPELRRRVRWTHPGEGRPALIDDPGFAIERHVTGAHLAGAADEDFWTWCAGQAVLPLEPDGPLWRAVFADGLAGGQVGLLLVVHHALIDGMAGGQLLAALLDLSPAAAVPAVGWHPRRVPGPVSLTLDAAAAGLAHVGAALRHPPLTPQALRAVRGDLAASAAAVTQRAPATSLDRAPSAGRRLAVLRRPLWRVRAVGRRCGATVNEVVLGALASGLRELLAARGDPLDGLELRVAVPVSGPLGPGGPGLPLPLVLPLPVGEPDPVRRQVLITAASRAAKFWRAPGCRGVAVTTPPTVLRLWLHWRRRHGQGRPNLYLTNAAGPTEPLWLCGARLTAAVPIAPLVAGVPLAAAVLSYAGELVLSIQVDDQVTDLDVLARGVAGALDGEEAAERRRRLGCVVGL
jgi:diacylglycerol O-acyltransferase